MDPVAMFDNTDIEQAENNRSFSIGVVQNTTCFAERSFSPANKDRRQE
jgi:hypothetical protein